jgi:hypothetical protein
MGRAASSTLRRAAACLVGVFCLAPALSSCRQRSAEQRHEEDGSAAAVAFQTEVGSAVRPGVTLLQAFSAIEESSQRHFGDQLRPSSFILVLTCGPKLMMIHPSTEPGNYAVLTSDPRSGHSDSDWGRSRELVRQAITDASGKCEKVELMISDTSPLRWRFNSSGVATEAETSS